MSANFPSLRPSSPIGFQSANVGPPSDLYLSHEDSLILTSWNSKTGVNLRLFGRLLRPDGQVVPVIVEQAPNTDRTAKTTVQFVGEGFLLSAYCVDTSNSAKRGHCFVQFGVSRGLGTSRLDYCLLGSDYVGAAVALSWPNSIIRHSLEGPGVLRQITGTDPAAGAEVSETVPTGARWRLRGIQVNLLCSATVADRYPRLITDDGTNNLTANPQPLKLVASDNLFCFWVPGHTWDTGIAVIERVAGLAGDALLGAGYRIRTATFGLQAGDNYGAPNLFVEEWIEV